MSTTSMGTTTSATTGMRGVVVAAAAAPLRGGDEFSAFLVALL